MGNPDHISAIFLDLGNTLRILVPDDQHQALARRQITALVGAAELTEPFCERLNLRYKNYRTWATENRIEASEKVLWTRWLLPEYPADRIEPIAVELTYLFRQSMGRRVMQQHGREVIVELYNRGYLLGIISNVITSREIPDWLEADGLSGYFKSVVLSSVFGRRKPDPAIYLEAARIAAVEPACCVYVGDNPKRDVLGTRLAGFGMVILMLEPEEHEKEPPTGENIPDLIIHTFSELLNVFPARSRSAMGNPGALDGQRAL